MFSQKEDFVICQPCCASEWRDSTLPRSVFGSVRYEAIKATAAVGEGGEGGGGGGGEGHEKFSMACHIEKVASPSLSFARPDSRTPSGGGGSRPGLDIAYK
jgi:hypothetical protein